jgi:hypothetical protein
LFGNNDEVTYQKNKIGINLLTFIVESCSHQYHETNKEYPLKTLIQSEIKNKEGENNTPITFSLDDFKDFDHTSSQMLRQDATFKYDVKTRECFVVLSFGQLIIKKDDFIFTKNGKIAIAIEIKDGEFMYFFTDIYVDLIQHNLQLCNVI